jgi:pyruvate/2-oxoglutarate dehydrogenase complex dihydrolipoamide dehydrogenase (E3) component
MVHAQSSCVLEVSERLKEVKVFEKLYDQFNFENPNVHVHIGAVTCIDFCGKHIFLHGIYCKYLNSCQKIYLKVHITVLDGNKISFRKLIICTGARPNVILRHPSVISVRDSDTVEVLRDRLLHSARRVAILGNGGISLELVHAVRSY